MLRLPRLHTLDAWLAYRDFRLLWLANFCGFTGQWLQLLSIGWLVKDLSAGTGVGGLLVLSVSAINTLPGLVVNPITGVLGDRLDRRKLAISMQSVSAALALGFAVLIAFDYVRPWHAYAYVLISGACLAITQPMQQVLISNTVPREALVNAYAINTLTVTGTRVFGPFVGGILIFTLGYFWNFALEAALYLGVVLMLLPMRTPYTGIRAGRRRAPDSPRWPTSRTVCGHLWRNQREVLEIAVLSVVPNTILHPVWFLLPLFTVEVLQAHANMGGYLLANHRRGRFDLHAYHRHLGHPVPARLYPVWSSGAVVYCDHAVCLLIMALGGFHRAGCHVFLPGLFPHYPGNAGPDHRSRPVPRPHHGSIGLRTLLPGRGKRAGGHFR